MDAKKLKFDIKKFWAGADIASSVFASVLRAAGGVVLIAVLTLVFFACIFTVYIKTNLTTGLELSLEEFDIKLSSIIYAKDPETDMWIELTAIQSEEYRIPLDYEEIPEKLFQTLVAIEDQRFYEHYGVDWYRTAGAFVTMFLANDNSFGGSTITQQLIKNLTGDDEVTIQRKMQEIFRALDFEQRYSKEEIITAYLNYVYFGKGAYGIAAAADRYLGKDVSALTVAEMASLIAIPNNPTIYNPYSYPENNQKRQRTILKQMFIQGYLTEAEYETALNQQLVFTQGKNTIYNQEIYTWFEEAVIDEVTADLMEQRGISKIAATRLLATGGYSIYSTVDLNIQAIIDEVYLDIENLPKTRGSEQQLQSSIVIVDPYTGYTVGIAGGVGEKTANRVKNRATQDLGRRPPGSAIKPIAVYAPAMDAGLITAETKMDDSPDVVLVGRKDGWLPNNDDLGYMNVIDIRTAVVRSRNVIAAQVLDKLTPAASYRFMTEKLGVSLLPEDENYAPLALGQLTMGTTAKAMASAYTMFPNNGVRMEAITYTKVLDRDGNLIFENKPEQGYAISETTAYWMTSILHDAAVRGTGAEANLGKMPTAGKTGTAGSSRDRWFVGYTPYYVAAVWSGYDVPERIRMASGGNPSSQIWKRIMAKIHEDLPVVSFNKPSNVYQKPVPGIKEVAYTITHQTELGTEFFTDTKNGAVGSEITVEAPEYEDFEIVGEVSKTIELNENAARNKIVFVYRAIPVETPPPEPTPTPTPPEDIEPTPTPTIDPIISETPAHLL